MKTSSVACPACRRDLRADAKFCDACGTPTSTAVEPAEYKQVTVLSADVVRSMDIAATVGPERLREIMAALVDRCSRVVDRYGGTTDKFTGDGIMALFGAPVALEDHAFRACLTALAIQDEVKDLADEVKRRDGVDLSLRIGLNSGAVIAGQLGTTPFGYTAVGEQVGIAQRMESVAPPGGVMLSQSTARLVQHGATLDAQQLVHVKGREEPLPAHRLREVTLHHGRAAAAEVPLVGRRREIAETTAVLDKAITGAGGVLRIVGPAGIGKSRLARETVAAATARGVPVFSTFCQSHARGIAFHAATGLLRALFGTGGVAPDQTRARIRALLSDAEDEDLLLLEDLLGIGEPDARAAELDADARRRRLRQVVRSAALARATPTIYLIEDAHWIDDVSESLIEALFSVLPQTRSLALLTHRPEYRGVLARTPGECTIRLLPLEGEDVPLLTAELLGDDPSVTSLAAQVGDRSAGNPFFAEEIVRDLVERGVLRGNRGAYVCRVDAADITVPATVQATIAARIDRVSPAAKRTLHAAAVIGSRFDAGLLAFVDPDAALTDLVEAELVEPVTAFRPDEYAFRHPLIRAVAYESQLIADRSELHRQVAEAIQQHQPSADENAALIASHLEAAGELPAAFGWHMRAGAWLTNRDIGAARASWQRAREIADRLPDDAADTVPMRIAPRTLLCGYAWRAGGNGVDASGFDELRELAGGEGHVISSVMGTSGILVAMTLNHRLRELVSLAPDYIHVLESTADPALILLINTASHGMFLAGRITQALALFQRAIDVADGNATLGNFFFESPLAWALTLRGVTRCSLGEAGWHEDLHAGVAMAREVQGITRAAVVAGGYVPAVLNGVLAVDATLLADTDETLRAAERSGDDVSLAWARITHGIMLVRVNAADSAGMSLLMKGRQQAWRHGDLLTATMADVQLAEYKARAAELDAAIEIARATTAHLVECGEVLFRGPATVVLVEALLQRGAGRDLQEAHAVVDELAACTVHPGFVLYELALLRSRAALARFRGDRQGNAELMQRYREMTVRLSAQL
ncbi:adenylate/guanylate cyclase domain-containing protein [Mycobacterium sp. 3519A]|uniref:ATP-binding protein n=1 Tax=Mycobacterium sp. 3519A TaxID=2057184 RepID=UPI001F1A5865|nr:adenylate/guanylate cyclase domain-containing protein [Mycobacterium sp. 3519A]